MNALDVLADLEAEQAALDEVLVTVSTDAWSRPTASARWSVGDQIGHLAYFDRTAALAITDPDSFTAGAQELLRQIAGADIDGMENATLATFRSMQPNELLAAWRDARSELATAGRTLTDDRRVIWYGPSMGAKSFLTARLMECWAHGQDVVDALDKSRPATDRLLHIAQLGFITRGWSYKNRGLEVPEADVRVKLTSPSGETWTFGPEDASEYVEGSAEEFCLVVTQRRNVLATSLVTSPIGLDWMQRAQVFAGPPTDAPAA